MKQNLFVMVLFFIGSRLFSQQSAIPLNYTQMITIGSNGKYISFNQITSDNLNGFVHNLSSYKIGQYLVTYELWFLVREYAEANGFQFQNKGRESFNRKDGEPPTEKGKYKPVMEISWRDAIIWCNAYSMMLNLTPCYYSDADMKVPLRKSFSVKYANTIDYSLGSFDNPYVKWEANGFRLPTEGEWRYAASYAGRTPYNYASGADVASVDTTGAKDIDNNGKINSAIDVAWCVNNTYGIGNCDGNDATQPVGLKEPNGFGLYDMSGNLIEFCYDWGGPAPQSEQVNYRGPEKGTWRMMCGASCGANIKYMGNGLRDNEEPKDENGKIMGPWWKGFIGLRVVQSNGL